MKISLKKCLSAVLAVVFVFSVANIMQKTPGGGSITAVAAESTSDPDLLAYDGFNGQAGSLWQQDLGFGFSKVYDYEGGGENGPLNTANEHVLTQESPFKYQNLSVSPMYMATSASSGRTGKGFDLKGGFAPYVVGDKIGKSGTELWFSFLMSSNVSAMSGIVFSEGNGFWHNGQEKFGVGVFSNDSSKDGKKYWSARVSTEKPGGDATGPVILSDKVAKPNETAFFVMNVKFGTKSTVNVYVNPDLSAPLGNPDITTETNYDMTFRGFTLHTGDATKLDEIRVGKTYHSVTPLKDYKIPVTKIRLYGANGDVSSLRGGRIEGSNSDATYGFETIAEIPNDITGTYVDLNVPNNTTSYRFVKLYGAPGSHGQVADIELYSNGRRMYGTPFGTTFEENAGPEYAFDDNHSTCYKGILENDQYVGLDLGGEIQVESVTADPEPGRYEEPIDIALSTQTDDAEIYYTTDGKMPTKNSNQYTAPIHLAFGDSIIIKAVAFKDGMPESDMVALAYGVGCNAPIAKGLRSYHLGNSLTDTLNSWTKKICDSAGYAHSYMRYTIPGAPTENIWQNFYDESNNNAPKPNNNSIGGDIFPWIDKYGVLTAEMYAPIDVLTTQPYSQHGRDVANEVKYASNFYDVILKYSPECRYIVYAQWPDYTATGSFPGNENYGLGKTPGVTFPYPTPKTWEEAVFNQQAVQEKIADTMKAKYPGHKVGNVIPGGAALVAVKKAIEAGEIEGISDFPQFGWDDVSKDSGHLSERGAYVVDLTVFTVMYSQSPVGRVTTWPSSLTENQAVALQKIVWDLCTSYSYSGIFGVIDEPETPKPSSTDEKTTGTPTSTVTPTPTPTVSQTPTPTATSTSVVTSPVLVNKTAYLQVGAVKVAKVKGSVKASAKVTVYKKASSKKGTYGKISKNKKVTVKSINGQYAKIKFGKKVGYVLVQYLKFGSKQSGVLLKNAKAYKQAKAGASYVTLKKNAKVNVQMITKGYYKITVKVKK